MNQIDVYDFDGTLYRGDSTVDFLFYCLGRKKTLWLLLLPVLGDALRLAVTRDLTVFKTRLFGHFARRIDLDAYARDFWKSEKTREKLNLWFYERPRDLPRIIASASPDFELKYAAEILGADDLICTVCDVRTGQVKGQNCKSSEKIRRIREKYGDVRFRAMYTDNVKADGPLLDLAQEKYLVKDGVLSRI